MIEVPESFIERIDTVATRILGSRDARGQALADEVARVSEIYTRRRAEIAEEAGGAPALAARLRFFLPRDMPKVAGPLAELHLAGALPASRLWRVLDLGAGVGTTTFGAARFAKERGVADALEVRAIDRDAAALDAMRALAADAASAGLARIDLDARTGDVRRDVPRGPFDLILLGLVLNELGDDVQARAAWLRTLAGELAEGGSIIVIEPALRETSRALHAVRDAIAQDAAPPNVFAPCLRAGRCPMLETERDWCHEDMKVALPEPIAGIARAAGLRFERLTYSYLTLRGDGRSLRDAIGGEPWRIVSQPLASKGKLELFGCGGLGRVRLMRLSRDRSQANAALDRADRGTLLRVEGSPDERGRVRIHRDTAVEESPPSRGPEPGR